MCAVALWCSAQAQAPALHFGRDGKFRIAQFTDVHLDLGTPYRRAQAEKTIAQMRYILDAEHPDLVVFTGDVVTGKPAAEAWHRVLEPVAERNLPFCVVLGNHDAEQDLTRAEIGRIVTSYAGTLNTLGAGGELADVVLEIAGTTQPAALLYCLDSHDYSTIPSIDGYGWFTQERVGWYRARSAAYTAANGGKPLPALALWHEFGGHIGRLVMMILYAYDPEAIVFGGSIAHAFGFFREAMYEQLKQFPYAKTVERLHICCSSVEHVGLLGASACE